MELVTKHHDSSPSLRTLSEHSNFGDTVKDILRDRLMCGINDQNIQEKLLSELRLTYEKAVDNAISIETADKDS